MSEITVDHAQLLELAGERLEDLADCLDCGQAMTELASGELVCNPCAITWDDRDDYLRDVERQAA